MRMAQLTDPSYDAVVKTQLEAVVKNEFKNNLHMFATTSAYASSVNNDMDADQQPITPSSAFPLLVSLYPEQAPMHPAFPAGHAVVAAETRRTVQRAKRSIC